MKTRVELSGTHLKNVLNMLEKAEGPAASPGDKVEGEVDVEVTEVMELEVGEDTESTGDNRELSEDNLQTVHICGTQVTCGVLPRV